MSDTPKTEDRPRRATVASWFERLVSGYNDRANVILGWPLLWLIDRLGALCDQWEYREQRQKSNAFLKKIWNRNFH